MGVVIGHDTELGKELVKWEQHHTTVVGPDQRPGNPYVYRPFPRMVYRAVKTEHGKVVCMQAMPEPTFYEKQSEYQVAYAKAEQLYNQCWRIVNDERELLIAKGQGFVGSPNDALEAFEREEQQLGNLAAEAAHRALSMGEKAREEFHAVNDEAGIEHIPDITPAVKRRVKEQAHGE